ncbi:hypothetical protein PPL_09442 [Heterostelium album PN500]|uniref:C2H2-type domain-containing protein n=1 Tax=Heterostelium pallidum (strain ATCC 26659 / Pp 5 / PN500) TaxID=670386 RepID=D3BPH4_HETP5|nr:hypothetical protein PPL_09442 [Heterostelium album PN500]EFA76692.1 hypothetical protein PPL_09442 [Heterostelium album PN500]|eukprot:XP_020428824.1 hypothetical protein PPL_09442 [Heterostelium album PN500]
MEYKCMHDDDCKRTFKHLSDVLSHCSRVHGCQIYCHSADCPNNEFYCSQYLDDYGYGYTFHTLSSQTSTHHLPAPTTTTTTPTTPTNTISFTAESNNFNSFRLCFVNVKSSRFTNTCVGWFEQIHLALNITSAIYDQTNFGDYNVEITLYGDGIPSSDYTLSVIIDGKVCDSAQQYVVSNYIKCNDKSIIQPNNYTVIIYDITNNNDNKLLFNSTVSFIRRVPFITNVYDDPNGYYITYVEGDFGIKNEQTVVNIFACENFYVVRPQNNTLLKFSITTPMAKCIVTVSQSQPYQYMHTYTMSNTAEPHNEGESANIRRVLLAVYIVAPIGGIVLLVLTALGVFYSVKRYRRMLIDVIIIISEMPMLLLGWSCYSNSQPGIIPTIGWREDQGWLTAVIMQFNCVQSLSLSAMMIHYQKPSNRNSIPNISNLTLKSDSKSLLFNDKFVKSKSLSFAIF